MRMAAALPLLALELSPCASAQYMIGPVDSQEYSEFIIRADSDVGEILLDDELPFLNPAERRFMGQVQGRTYANMFRTGGSVHLRQGPGVFQGPRSK